MEKPENVNIATQSDIERIYFPLMRSYEDNDLGLTVSPAEVMKTVTAMCNGDGGIAGVIDGNNGVAASIAIRAVQPWFTKQTMLTEVWLFIAPAYRKHNRFFTDLLDFAEWHRRDMSERLGYDMVLENAVMHRERLPAASRLYQGYYGPPIGAVFWARGGQEHVLQQDQHEQSGPEQHGPVERLPVGSVDEFGAGSERPERLRRPVAAGGVAFEPAAAALRRPNGRAPDGDAE